MQDFLGCDVLIKKYFYGEKSMSGLSYSYYGRIQCAGKCQKNIFWAAI